MHSVNNVDFLVFNSVVVVVPYGLVKLLMY